MLLWEIWWQAILPLREACSREVSFMWLATTIAGISTRGDLMGVTSIVRSLGLVDCCYGKLLDFYHSPAVMPDRLGRVWTKTVIKLFGENVYRFNGKPVLLGDGLKIAKSGRKMPGVKLLHQVSESNTKPEYIMGHSLQVVSLLACSAGSFFAVPLMGLIHEGVVFSNRDKRTLPGKFCDMLSSLDIGECYLVADAYYACRGIIRRLLEEGSHLVSRVRRNTVAYSQVQQKDGKRRGRPRLYGQKIILWKLFTNTALSWIEIESPVYDEQEVKIQLLAVDLVWKPVCRLVRFVLVKHPLRGSIILISTDLSMEPVEVVRLYGLRFKIEVSFKQALRTLGAYAYHFWMRNMKKIKRCSGNQHLHHETEKYRNDVRRKITAYHRHIMTGLIAQGVQQYLSCRHSNLVWSSFGSWLRTIRAGVAPSEFVVKTALRTALPNFIMDDRKPSSFTKFIRDKLDITRAEGLRLTG